MSLIFLILVFTVVNFIIAPSLKRDVFIDILEIDGMSLKVISRISLIPPVSILILMGIIVWVVFGEIYKFIVDSFKEVW